jgi:phosphoesterase RecJ-like protein
VWLRGIAHTFFCILANGELTVEQEFAQCKKIIQQNQRFILTTHVNPDPDAIGSELALARFLVASGKDALIFNHSATPFNCEFLDPEKTIVQFEATRDSAKILGADVIFILDTNHPDRLESLKPFFLESTAKKVCVDHHLDKAEFADLYLIDESSTATGEILYRLLTSFDDASITKSIAEPLYAAIMTDTGSFRFPKTDSDVHRFVAHLIDCGADPAEIYQQIYEQGSANRTQLLGHALSTLNLGHGDKVAYFAVTKHMFEQTGTKEEDTDNFISYTLRIRGVQIGLMFTELPDAIKVSFRSKGDIGINKLAQEFGGNGHMNAAGARVRNARLANVIAAVVERSRHYVK